MVVLDDNTSDADLPDSGELCEGAALVFHGVCFRAHSVTAMGYEHPLELDGPADASWISPN
ncbi:MAG: hypothetical protein HC927_00600 [Deltaproteobacteria bacterium]|nr:hypothetical protein [Deltaproteobacteria bacterium]